MGDRHLCYVIGEPGVGKTTLIEKLTEGHAFEEATSPFAHRVYDVGPWEIGRRRENGFSGTDALAMDIQPDVLSFMESIHPKLVLAEGDRLANNKFFTSMSELGYELHLYHLMGVARAAEHRDERGSQQNETWIKGRRTKCKALAEKWEAKEIYAVLKPEALVLLLTDPVAAAFRND